MKIIPKFQWGSNPSWNTLTDRYTRNQNENQESLDLTGRNWYYDLWKNSESVLNLPKVNNYNNNLSNRQSGYSLNQSFDWNEAYQNSGKIQEDVTNYFNNLSNAPYDQFQNLLDIYNSDIKKLHSTFNSPLDYSKPSEVIADHNRRHKAVYGNRNNNSGKAYDIGWDDNVLNVPGSATQGRRPLVYSTTFQDDLKNNLEQAKKRVVKITKGNLSGNAYIDELGYLQQLTPDQEKQLIENTGDTTRALENKPIEFSPGLQSALDKSTEEIVKGSSGDDGTRINPTSITDDKANWLSKLQKFSPFITGGLRVIADNYANSRNTEEYIKHLNPPLQDPWQAYRMVHGDYIAKQNAEQQAARLRSTASRAFTSDADKQMAYELEAVDKGNQMLLAGQQRDAQEFYRTSELAANQAIQNIQNRTQVANTNRQLASQYEEMKARLRYNTKTQNMQNWDKYWSIWEDRALAKYDYNQKRQQDLQEALDYSLMNYGVDNSRVRAAYKQLEDTYGYDTLTDDQIKQYESDLLGTDDVKKKEAEYYLNRHKQKLAAQEAMRKEVKALQFAKLKRQAEYLGLDFEQMKRRQGISAKNGGVLRKLQQGGGFQTVQWTPLMGSPYQQYLSLLMSGKTESSSKSSKKSSSSSSDKQEASLAKSIIETLKGGDLLQSDMNVIAAQMTKFFDLQRYSLDDELDENMLYRGYINMLSQVNRAKQSANNFKEAYDNVLKNGGLHEPAINEQGLVYVGIKGTDKLNIVTPEQYFENEDKYILMTNQDLLYLRQNHLSQAFNDTNIISAASNGVGMDQVSKFVKEIVGTLGHDKNSRDQLVYNFGEQAAQGFKVLEDLKSKGFTNEETNAVMSGGLKALWELNTVTQDQYKQASQAISAVWQALPANMRSLLTLRTGSKEGAADLISKMILSGTTYESSFKVSDITPLDENGNLKSSTKTGKGGSEGDSEAQSRTTTNIQRGMGGSKDNMIINPGTKAQMSVDVVNYFPEGAENPSSLQSALAIKDINGVLSSKSKIYFGDQVISPDNFKDIVYLGRGFSRAILPAKADGSPDFEIFEKFDKVCEATRQQGFDPVLILNGKENRPEAIKFFGQQLLKQELYGLVSRDGIPDVTRMGVFLVTEGLASDKAKIKESTFVTKQKDPDYDLMKRLLSTKGADGKVEKYDIDDPDWVELWGVLPFYDKIYEGTIYIPISTNELQGASVDNKLKDGTVQRLEQDYQYQSKVHQYRPTESTTESILSQ